MAENALLQDIQARYGSGVVGGFQALRFVYYSKQTYSTAGSTNFNFFGDVLGQNGVTITTTNMTRANSFPQRAFLVRAIRTNLYFPSSFMQVASSSPATGYLGALNDVVNSSSVLTWKIQDKDYLQIAQPLAYCPFGSGIRDNVINTVFPSTATLANNSFGTVSPQKDDIFILDPPQYIEAEVTFQLSIQFAAAVAVATAGTIGCFLDGILFRPIQ